MQLLINGLSNAAAIAILALAFRLIYASTRVFFLGLAGIYASAPYVAQAAINLGLPPLVSFGAAIAAGALLGTLSYSLVHGPLIETESSPGVQLLSSLGLYLVITQSVTLMCGTGRQQLRLVPDIIWQWGTAIATGAQVIKISSCLAAAGLLAYIFHRADLGRRLRALAELPQQFALLGYNLATYRRLAFALGGGLAALSSLVSAYDFGFDPANGLPALLLAIIAAIIGGNGYILGPVVGAIVLGMTRVSTEWYGSSRWQEPVTFSLLAVFLLLKPQGIFSSKRRLEDAR